MHSLPTGQKLAHLVQLDNVLAEEELRTNPWGKGLSTDQFYDMVLAATGSESEARARAKARRRAMVAAGLESM